MKRLPYLLGLCLLLPLSAQAAPTKQEISLKVLTDFVIPAYENLAVQATEQKKVWQTTCNAADLKESFQKTSDAWASVQNINFGPVILLLRRDRMYHWPERRNAVSKSLNHLLADKNNEKALTHKYFSASSVAVQGLPAMERLLYTDLLKDDWSCKVGRTIADNIAEIATGTVKDWKDTLTYIKEGKSHPIYFESMDEVAIRLFTELLTGFQMISDQKVALPMSTSITKANGKRAEGWRSHRSTRYIQKNAQALMDFSKPFMSFLPEPDRNELLDQFATFEKAADDLPPSIKDAVSDEKGRENLKSFLSTARTTRNLIVDKFTKQLDLAIGFNSLDGD